MTESARIYDLDGTLVHLAVDWQAAERELRDVVAGADIGVDPERHDVWTLYDVAEEHGIGAAFESRLAGHERDGAERSKRLAAADEVAELSVPVAVCSLNCEAACRIALERHELTAHVDAVVGRDTVAHRKPHPQPLLAAIEAVGADPTESLFIGDSARDARCAERAGVRFTAVDGTLRNH